MDFFELVKARQSVRKYSSRPVEREKIERCIEAAKLAPSACNAQPWRFIVVDDPALKNEVAKETYNAAIAFNKFVPTAPVILVIVVEKSELAPSVGAKLKGIDYEMIDTGIAAEHICLQATELGLGTCMLGWFNQRPIKKLLNIPSGRKIALLITMGYPEDENVRDKVRKTSDEVFDYNKYR